MSTGGKHRRSGIKRDHSILNGLEAALKPVTELPSVKVCIPGRIARTSARGQGLSAKGDTPDGLKLSYRQGNGVQEVFVVTSDREEVRSLMMS